MSEAFEVGFGVVMGARASCRSAVSARIYCSQPAREVKNKVGRGTRLGVRNRPRSPKREVEFRALEFPPSTSFSQLERRTTG